MDLDSDDFFDPLNIMFSFSSDYKYDEPKKKRRCRVRRPDYLERNRSGAFGCVFSKILNDPQLFYNYSRMSLDQFEELLEMVTPLIQKETVLRELLSPNLRLAVTLRYLATGESQTSLALAYNCSQTSVHRILKETARCITAVLKPKVFPDLTLGYFKNIAAGFEHRWNFPNCVGAIGGKHVTIQAPSNSGSEFYNCKKTSSIVFMAICDHDYNFIWCNIGSAGHQNDDGNFRESNFGKRFYAKTLPIPQPRDISQNFKQFPYVFVADDAFALHENMLKPFATIKTNKQEVFNCRLSRAHSMIENCFGILCANWRIFETPIIADVSMVEEIIQSCVCLHNWLRKKNNGYITPELLNRETDGNVVQGALNNYSNELLPLRPRKGNSTTTAKLAREKFAEYFSAEGQVECKLPTNLKDN